MAGSPAKGIHVHIFSSYSLGDPRKPMNKVKVCILYTCSEVFSQNTCLVRRSAYYSVYRVHKISENRTQFCIHYR